MTLPEIERELRAAMDAWVARGGKIARGAYPTHTKTQCAIDVYFEITGEPLPLSRDMSGAFIDAFDGEHSRDTQAYPAIAALGRKLAREYVDGIKEGQ